MIIYEVMKHAPVSLQNQIYMSLNLSCCLESYLRKCPLTPGAINYRSFQNHTCRSIVIFFVVHYGNSYLAVCQTVIT